MFSCLFCPLNSPGAKSLPARSIFFSPRTLFSSLRSIPMVTDGCGGRHRGGVRSEDDRGDPCQMQRAACARAARCDSRCSVLRWPMHRAVSFTAEYSRVAGSAVCPSAQPPPAGRRSLSQVGPKPLGICTLALGECRLGRWAELPSSLCWQVGAAPQSDALCCPHLAIAQKNSTKGKKVPPPYLYVNQMQ